MEIKTEAEESFRKTWNSIRQVMPILLGVMLLIALAITVIPVSLYSQIFSGSFLLDPLIGAAVGSIAAGNPINSYVIGGELLQNGVSLLAVSAFLITWVTVGIIQLPTESLMLGRRFALVRNFISFVLAVAMGIVLVSLLELLG